MEEEEEGDDEDSDVVIVDDSDAASGGEGESEEQQEGESGFASAGAAAGREAAVEKPLLVPVQALLRGRHALPEHLQLLRRFVARVRVRAFVAVWRCGGRAAQHGATC